MSSRGVNRPVKKMHETSCEPVRVQNMEAPEETMELPVQESVTTYDLRQVSEPTATVKKDSDNVRVCYLLTLNAAPDALHSNKYLMSDLRFMHPAEPTREKQDAPAKFCASLICSPGGARR
jgi:hypothetical protein